MKKITLAFVIVVLLSTLALAGCGGTEAAVTTTSPETTAATDVSPSTTAPTEAPSTTSAAPTFEPVDLRMSTHANPKQRFHQAASKWIELVGQRTNGAVKIEVFDSGSLYQPNTVGDPLMNGDIDLALTSPGTFGKLVPASALDWLNWGAPTLEGGWALLAELYASPEYAAILDAEFEKLGVKLLFSIPNSVVRGPLMTKGPVQTMADMKGQLIYAPAPSVAALIEALGGKSVFVPTGEVYTALERGTFNGALSQQELYLAHNLYEKAEFMTEYVYAGGIMPFFISLKTWDKLPQEVQQLMLDTGKEIQEEWFSTQAAFDQEVEKQLVAKGMQVVTLSADEKAAWDAALLKSSEAASGRDPSTQKVWELWTKLATGSN